MRTFIAICGSFSRRRIFIVHCITASIASLNILSVSFAFTKLSSLISSLRIMCIASGGNSVVRKLLFTFYNYVQKSASYLSGP
jgi:hypothetical protein